jgi:hypothetical protein
VSTWSDEDLLGVADSTELQLASRRSDGTLQPYTTMWVVRFGDDLYVRSAGGPNRLWYRHALAAGTGRIRAGGVEADVTFDQAAADAHEAIDAAYHAKYDNYGPQIVGSVVGPKSHQVTIRLVAEPGR